MYLALAVNVNGSFNSFPVAVVSLSLDKRLYIVNVFQFFPSCCMLKISSVCHTVLFLSILSQLLFYF
ncbi:MAG: hypothetical protein RMI04_09700, partial [Thermofilaceae archaeon]|nr:hypothetical protein [Thermofilaceae archaeon]